MNRFVPRFVALVACVMLAACVATSPTPAASAPATPSEPTASASASPSLEPTEAAAPSEPASPDVGEPGGFTLLPNPEADALFEDPDDCENLEDGYRLEYPDPWYTNTEIGSVPPCRWFSPTFYEVADPTDLPDEIAIQIVILQGDRGYTTEPISREEVVVGATQTAVRVEVAGTADSDSGMSYEYVVQLGPTLEDGPNLLARTDTDMGGDYELNKAILDRIMASIEFVGTVQ